MYRNTKVMATNVTILYYDLEGRLKLSHKYESGFFSKVDVPTFEKVEEDFLKERNDTGLRIQGFYNFNDGACSYSDAFTKKSEKLTNLKEYVFTTNKGLQKCLSTRNTVINNFKASKDLNKNTVYGFRYLTDKKKVSTDTVLPDFLKGSSSSSSNNNNNNNNNNNESNSSSSSNNRVQVEDEKKRLAEAEKKRLAEAEKKRLDEDEKKRKAEADNKRLDEADNKRKAEADNNLTVVTTNVNVAPIYVENQVGSQCGKHAINHVLQCNFLSNITLPLLCPDVISDVAKTINSDEESGSHCGDKLGNDMNIDGIKIILQIYDYETIHIGANDQKQMEKCLKKRMFMGFIINTGDVDIDLTSKTTHYVAVIKNFTNSGINYTFPYIYIDSVGKKSEGLMSEDFNSISLRGAVCVLGTFTSGQLTKKYGNKLDSLKKVQVEVSPTYTRLMESLDKSNEYLDLDDIKFINENKGSISDYATTLLVEDAPNGLILQGNNVKPIKSLLEKAIFDKGRNGLDNFLDHLNSDMLSFIYFVNDINEEIFLDKKKYKVTLDDYNNIVNVPEYNFDVFLLTVVSNKALLDKFNKFKTYFYMIGEHSITQQDVIQKLSYIGVPNLFSLATRCNLDDTIQNPFRIGNSSKLQDYLLKMNEGVFKTLDAIELPTWKSLIEKSISVIKNMKENDLQQMLEAPIRINGITDNSNYISDLDARIMKLIIPSDENEIGTIVDNILDSITDESHNGELTTFDLQKTAENNKKNAFKRLIHIVLLQFADMFQIHFNKHVENNLQASVTSPSIVTSITKSNSPMMPSSNNSSNSSSNVSASPPTPTPGIMPLPHERFTELNKKSGTKGTKHHVQLFEYLPRILAGEKTISIQTQKGEVKLFDESLTDAIRNNFKIGINNLVKSAGGGAKKTHKKHKNPTKTHKKRKLKRHKTRHTINRL